MENFKLDPFPPVMLDITCEVCGDCKWTHGYTFGVGNTHMECINCENTRPPEASEKMIILSIKE